MKRAANKRASTRARFSLALAVVAAAALIGPLASTARADSSCVQPGYAAFYIWVAHEYTYAIKGSSVPSVPGGGPIDAIIRGRHVWNNTTNTCGYSDASNLTAYNQTSSANIGFSQGDGYNRIDFGRTNFSGCNGAVACTALQVRQNAFIQEVDTRFNNALAWRTDGANAGHDIWNTSSHESGHAIGFDHVGGTWLTMYPDETTVGELRKRTLACGDVRALRFFYGGTIPNC